VVAVALAAEHPTAATLAAQGVRITLVSTGLAATRVDLACPPSLAPVVKEALAWRIDIMCVQLRASRSLGGVARTPVAVPDLQPRMAPAFTWRGPVEYSGRIVWQTRTAQRPEGGWCGSCGEAHASTGETGDCALCNAARIGALRAEGLLPAATPLPALVPPMAPTTWQARDGRGLREAVVPARVPWTCACGFLNVGCRREVEGCGACATRANAVMDLSRLGGNHHAL